ncbi:MAG: tetratricopeptide repeat protein [Deltaproteobacteria bacterium]|nr:tetratricopeptide repeat protein [Deltaproteobacteria bacterium]
MTIGLICVLALVAAAIVLVYLDRQAAALPPRAANPTRSPLLGRMILLVLVGAFVGGVALVLASGIRPRTDHPPMGMSMPMGNGSDTAGMPQGGSVGVIGTIDPAELRRLEAAVAADSNDVRARERLGHLYLQQQDFEKVFAMAHEALKLDPKSVESRVHMGVVLFANQDLPGAMAQIDKALALDPTHVEALRFKKMFAMAASRGSSDSSVDGRKKP